MPNLPRGFISRAERSSARRCQNRDPARRCQKRDPVRRCQNRDPARRPGGFAIRRQKMFDLLNRGICNPPPKGKHIPLLRISNPQSLNRLGPFLTPDFKSGGTPGGLAFLAQRRLAGLRSWLKDAWRACVPASKTPGGLAFLAQRRLSGLRSCFKSAYRACVPGSKQ
mgnify:CR=1 FL=1